MALYHIIDALGCFTGTVAERPDTDGVPPGWIAAPPPELGVGEWAVWANGGRQVVASKPQWPAPSLEDLRAAKLAAIAAKLDAVLTGGYTVQSGDMAGKVLQTRGIEDRTNWMMSRTRYAEEVANGNGEAIGALFRTEDNSTFVLSFADGLDVLRAMESWGFASMAHSWPLKDAALAAPDAAALDAIDIEAGWPG